MPMQLLPRTAPTIEGEHSFGSAEKTLSQDNKIKIQITGAGPEVLLLEGPPAGKQWLVVLNVFVRETDA